ncbi:MAG: hypothetical protein N3E50_08920 [Candidatus Goldbacteria bacterium]|nr:hypothetical protein [Candidatus Goldiibacteriota bacterium]
MKRLKRKKVKKKQNVVEEKKRKLYVKNLHVEPIIKLLFSENFLKNHLPRSKKIPFRKTNLLVFGIVVIIIVLILFIIRIIPGLKKATKNTKSTSVVTSATAVNLIYNR